MKSAIVIGAGPAGLSAAIGLLRAGFQVRVFDQRQRGQGRVCGGYLNSEACRHLEWLGVMEKVRSESCVVDTVSLSSTKARSYFRASYDNQPTLGLSRDRLEEILQDRMEQEGGQTVLGKRIDTLDPSADLTVIAAGRFGLSRKTPPQKSGWYGWNANFTSVAHNEGSLSLHFYNNGYVGLLALKNGVTNACGLIYVDKKENFSIESIYQQACATQPHLRQLMKDAERVSNWKGVGPLPYGKWITPHDTALLVGDSAAVGDPFMGEGIGRALGAGPMLHGLFSRDMDVENIGERYHAVWDETYGKRLKLGWLLRQNIYAKWFFPPVLNFLVAHPFWLDRAMPYFQSGYFYKKGITTTYEQ